jgi:hypothetical protein
MAILPLGWQESLGCVILSPKPSRIGKENARSLEGIGRIRKTEPVSALSLAGSFVMRMRVCVGASCCCPGRYFGGPLMCVSIDGQTSFGKTITAIGMQPIAVIKKWPTRLLT